MYEVIGIYLLERSNAILRVIKESGLLLVLSLKLLPPFSNAVVSSDWKAKHNFSRITSADKDSNENRISEMIPIRWKRTLNKRELHRKRKYFYSNRHKFFSAERISPCSRKISENESKI